MITARDLKKRYGEATAVDGVSFEVARGEVFGLLGPNGAGKTTTLKMLVGALAPDGGSVAIDGEDDPTKPAVRARIGIAPQELAIYDELSGEENLRFFGRLYGLRGRELQDRVAQALEFAGLSERRRDRAAKYSGGMKRRLNLACALVHEPAILLCDEPTAGVDPQSRNHVYEGLERLRDRGCTLLYTTHYIEEAQRLCDRVAILDHGRLLALDTADALIDAHGGTSVVEAEVAGAPAPDLVAALHAEANGSTLRIETERPLEAVAELGRRGVEITRLRVSRPDLERVFLHLTGRTLRD